jgi:pyridoxal phosphate enzyme (YggS family)
MQAIHSRIEAIRRRMQRAAQQAERPPEAITLIAVSKTRSVQEMEEAYAAGCRHFGESYAQEAVAKIDRLQDKAITWHFIGPIQSNKTQAIAAKFDWVHSVDREKIAERLNRQRPEGCAPLNVCIQVNVTQEAAKSGVSAASVSELAKRIADLPHLRLRGLMTMARKDATPQELRQGFANLRVLLEALNSPELALDTLSMGMSGDFEAAILEGATHVRIGTGIFGPRPKR